MLTPPVNVLNFTCQPLSSQLGQGEGAWHGERGDDGGRDGKVFAVVFCGNLQD